MDFRTLLGLVVLAVVVLLALVYWEWTRWMLKNLRRNRLRSVLTGLAIFVLVLVVTLVWSVLAFLDHETEAKSKNIKAIITEKYQLPSRMPYQYAASLAEGAPQREGDYRIDPDKDAMAWSFYVGTLDPAKQTRDNVFFFFAMEPRKLMSLDADGSFNTMMDDLDQVSHEDKRRLAADCAEMEKDPYKVVIGPGRLAAINKKVGERIKVTSLNYSGIDLAFEIQGVLPGNRYDQNAVMSYRYLDEALRTYNKGKSKAQQHPMTEKSLAVMWLRLPDTATFERVAEQVMSAPQYRSPAVKCETASSGVATFLDAYRDLLFGMRWLLVPAILVTMALVIANAIGISVRERRQELAVLKALGFSPNQILILVLGEALFIGCGTGLVSAGGAWYVVNNFLGGIAVSVEFFGKFFVDAAAPWWGLGIGAVTALAGSLLPAWSARSIKVSEVFARIN